VIEELHAGAPSLVQQSLRALVSLGIDDEPFLPSGIIADRNPPSSHTVKLHYDTGHHGTFIVDYHRGPSRWKACAGVAEGI
jgi:hypothetical protein